VRSFLIKLSRYFITGGSAAIVDAGGFALLERAGVPLAAAAILSFCIATVVNYTLTARFVFGQRAAVRGFRLFFVVALIGLALNVGITVGTNAAFALPPILAKITGIGIAFFANFLMNVHLVFRGDAKKLKYTAPVRPH
jgi:putative flippase GtrA